MAYVKRIKRTRKSKKPRNMYFHAGTQEAIVQYQATDDLSIREQLYLSEIFPAFTKLAENLIFMHGFAKGTDFETLRNDCITHLYESLCKWDPERGTKAFSYYNVVAKHFLIIQSKKRKKDRYRHISISDESLLSATEKRLIEKSQIAPSPDEIMINRHRPEEIKKLLVEIRSRVANENEIVCIDSIIEIFSSVDDLEFLNKRAIFVYLRELSGLSPKKLSIAMSVIRRHYRELSKTDDFDIF
jgi:hypothetical protein